MTRLQAIGVTVCLLISTVSVADDIYKWVNEKGQVSYGNNPPKGVDARIVTTTGGPSESDVNEAKAINDSIGSVLSSKPSGTPLDPAALQAKQEACDAAKAEYEKISSASRISVKDDEGNLQKVDADKRQEMVNERQAAVDKACAP